MSWAQRDTTLQKNNIFIYIHRLTKNRLVIQIQKALWRKLEPLYSRNKMLYASKTEVTENALELQGKSFRPCRYKDHNKSTCVP